MANASSCRREGGGGAAAAGGRARTAADPARLLVLLLLSATAASASGAVMTCGSPGGNFTATAPGSGQLVMTSTAFPNDCTWVVGAAGATTKLFNIVSDGDPGFAYTMIYDGATATPATLVLQLEGYLAGNPALFPPSAPLVSTSGFFTVVWSADTDAYPGNGFLANYSITAGATPSPPPPPVTVPSPAGPSANVSTLQGLVAAFAAPAVTSVTLTASVSLQGWPLALAGAGRKLALTGACAGGPCVLNARGASRHFSVTGGAALSLHSLSLVNGFALQGGSVLASGAGSAVSAIAVAFANNTAVGDGGAVLAQGGASATVGGGSSFVNCTSANAFGGAAAAVLGSSLAVTSSSVSACWAQSGGAFVGAFGSTLALSNVSTSNTASNGYAGAASVMFASAMTATASSFVGCSSTFDGGCLHAWRGSTISLAGSTVSGGVTGSGASGACVAAHFSPNVTVVNSTLANCTADYQAGALYVWHSLVTVSGSSVTGNVVANGAGGAFCVQGGLPLPWCAWDCSVASLLLVGSTVSGNVANDNGGGAISAYGSGALTVVNSVLNNNTSPSGSGGAINFASADKVLTVTGSTLEGNSALSCGAVAVTSAAAVNISDSQLVANAATAGDGGAMCYSPPPLTATQSVCVNGVTLQLSAPTGDISPVTPGQQLPTVPLACAWSISAPVSCLIELQIVEIDAVKPLTNFLTINDVASGLSLYNETGPSSPPPPFKSTSAAGLLLAYNIAQGGDAVYTGFIASYRTLCPGPGGSTVSSDSMQITLSDTSAVGNTATGFGGALAVEVQPGYSGTRSAQVAISGGSWNGNTAALGGGAVYAVTNVALQVGGGASLANNAAPAGAGGALLVQNSASVLMNGASFSGNTAGLGGGAVALAGTLASIVACSFSGNGAAGDGGALSVASSPSLLVSGGSFAGNMVSSSTGGRGGAVALFNVSNATLAGGALQGNLVQTVAASVGNLAATISTFRAGDGGALFAYNPASAPTNLTLTSLVLSANGALSRAGGAMSLWGAIRVAAANVTVDGNSASRAGGGVAVGFGVQAAFNNCTFVENAAGSLSSSSLNNATSGLMVQPSQSSSSEVGGAAAQARASCAIGSSATASGTGGALWVADDGAVVLTNCALVQNAADGWGGALFVSSNGAVTAVGGALTNNNAKASGGAVALGGTANLTLAGTAVSLNSATFGGFMGLLSSAVPLGTAATVSLANVVLQGNYAEAGGLYYSQAPTAFTPPTCIGTCVGSTSGGLATSYGATTASPPTQLLVTAPSGTVTGSPLAPVLKAVLLDAFNSTVKDLPVLGSVTCLQQVNAAGVAAACDPSALLGAVRASYSNGSAAFSPLVLYGPPASTFTLQVSVSVLANTDSVTSTAAVAPVSFNVTVAACGRLQLYNPGSRLCICALGAVQSGSGRCECATGYTLVTAAGAAGNGSAAAAGAATCVLQQASALAASSSGPEPWVVGVAVTLSSVGATAFMAALVHILRRGMQSRELNDCIIEPHELQRPRSKSRISDVTARTQGGATPGGVAAAALLAGDMVEYRGTPVFLNLVLKDAASPLPAVQEEGRGGTRGSGALTSGLWGGRTSNETARSSGGNLDSFLKRMRPSAASEPTRLGFDRRSSKDGIMRGMIGEPEPSPLRGGAGPSGGSGSSSFGGTDAAAATAGSGVRPTPGPSAADEELTGLGAVTVSIREDAEEPWPEVSVGSAAGGGFRPPPRTSTASRPSNSASDSGERRPSEDEATLPRGARRSQSRPAGSNKRTSSGIAGSPEFGQLGPLDARLGPRAFVTNSGHLRRVNWAASNLVQLCRMRHPNLVSIFGACELQNRPVLVEAYMASGSLRNLLSLRALHLDFAVVTRMARQVAAACRFLHESRPQQVACLGPNSIVVDADLNAKVRLRFEAVGMPPAPPTLWSSPEVLSGGAPTAASDTYAFGMLLYELFTRDEVFADMMTARTASEVMDLVVEEDRRPAFPPTVPAALRAVSIDCWHRNPARRPPFNEVEEELRTALAEAEPAMTGAARESALDERWLLEQIMPGHVADQLKRGIKVEPEYFEDVTIFFSDIVGFTELSSKLLPDQVMAMLDRLYTLFDALTEHHGLFKVETIGDAYMVCGNILEKGQSADHCARVAAFALDAVEVAKTVAILESDPSMGRVNIRAGFHCGPVVASVVGRARPRYCLFGDTVNVAARMEGSSLPNRVNLSAQAAARLMAQSPKMAQQMESRGRVSVKGKGLLELFWLNPALGSVPTLPMMRKSSLALRTRPVAEAAAPPSPPGA